MNIKKFLFENIGIKQTIFKNTFWLTIAEVITQLLKIFLIIYVARVLGAEEYGKFSFALSFVCIIVIFAELGLPDIITREFSKNKDSEKEYSSIISLKLLLSMGAFLLMFVSSFFITNEYSIRKSIWLLTGFILITSFINIFYAFFRARQRMEYEAFFKIFQYTVLTILSFIIIITIPSIENLSHGYFISNALILVILLIFFHFFIQPIKIHYNKNVWLKFTDFSWPLILGVSIGWIYISVSSVMLGYFGYHVENGWYSASYKVIGATVLSATLISRGFFPVLNIASQQSKETIQRIWNYQKELMIVFAFPLMVGGVVLAPKIINFFYDASFAPSVPAFQWLTFVFAIDFLYYPYALALIIFGQEKKAFLLTAIGLAINVILNLLLISRYVLQGVLLSNLISSAIVLVLAIFMTMKYTHISPFNTRLYKTLLVVIISSVVMFFVINNPFIYSLNLLIVISLGVVSYFLVFYLFYLILKIKKILKL